MPMHYDIGTTKIIFFGVDNIHARLKVG